MLVFDSMYALPLGFLRMPCGGDLGRGLLSIDFKGCLGLRSIMSWSILSSNSSTFGSLLSSNFVFDRVVTSRGLVGLVRWNFDLPGW